MTLWDLTWRAEVRFGSKAVTQKLCPLYPRIATAKVDSRSGPCPLYP